MKNTFFIQFTALLLLISPASAQNENLNMIVVEEEDNTVELPDDFSIFDDRMLLDGYTQKFTELDKDILTEMMKDDTLAPIKSAAAIRVFKQNYIEETVSRDKRVMEKILLRRMNRSDSPFVKVEIMHTLCMLDRYRYFKSMVPALIQKLDHYNSAVNLLAYEALDEIIHTGQNRAREARIVFNTLRKVLFLSRKRFEGIKIPDEKLKQKLTILRWSIKILGTQELKRLPKEVLGIL